MEKNFLVTGGAGFIGTNLTKQLLQEGNKVIIVDDLSAGDHRDRLPEEAVFYKIDIRDTAALTEVAKGVDVIIHLAALPRVQFSIQHPQIGGVEQDCPSSSNSSSSSSNSIHQLVGPLQQLNQLMLQLKRRTASIYIPALPVATTMQLRSLLVLRRNQKFL